MKIPGGSRPCKLPAQKGSGYCHLHEQAEGVAAAPIGEVALDRDIERAGEDALSPAAWSINGLVEDKRVWEDLLDVLGERIKQPHLLESMVEKDLYVTEAIRHAIVPSSIYPDASVVFKGGTSLAKAYPIVKRFSEDVDVNIIPPPGKEFGHSRRKQVRRELHARLDSNIPLEMEHKREGTNFATTTITYTPSRSGSNSGAGVRLGTVLVEMNIRDQPQHMFGTRQVTSLAGEAAAELDWLLLEEYPFLKPFDVLTADPMIAVVDKLDALNWRGESDNPEQIASRARDIYDLARLLPHELVRPNLTSDLVSQMHATVLESIPTGLAGRATPRPEGGFAGAKAFQPGHPAHDALKAEYPRIKDLVYSDEEWVEFDEAMDIIQGCSHLL